MNKRYIKYFQCSSCFMVDEVVGVVESINKRIRENNVYVIAISVLEIYDDWTYFILYENINPEIKEVISEEQSEVPIIDGATSPTIPVIKVENGKKVKMQAMAGVFGVPEGHKLHPEDDEPAPAVALSPDCKMSDYADLFGNIKD